MSETNLLNYMKTWEFGNTPITIAAPHHAPWDQPCPSNKQYDWNTGVAALGLAKQLNCRLVVADRLREHADPNKKNAGQIYNHYLKLCTENSPKTVIEIHGMSSKYRFLFVASTGRAQYMVSVNDLELFIQTSATLFNSGDPPLILSTTKGKNPEPTMVFYHEKEGYTLSKELNRLKGYLVARNTNSLVDFDKMGIRPLHLEIETQFRKPPKTPPNLWVDLKKLNPQNYPDDQLPKVLDSCGKLPRIGKRLVDALIPAIKSYSKTTI